jgi:hypothetical protein
MKATSLDGIERQTHTNRSMLPSCSKPQLDTRHILSCCEKPLQVSLPYYIILFAALWSCFMLSITIIRVSNTCDGACEKRFQTLRTSELSAERTEACLHSGRLLWRPLHSKPAALELGVDAASLLNQGENLTAAREDGAIRGQRKERDSCLTSSLLFSLRSQYASLVVFYSPSNHFC